MSETLQTILETSNLAMIEDIAQDGDIVRRVRDGYDRDEQSRMGLIKIWEEVNRLLETNLSKKSYPFEHASNVNIPALYNAVSTFAARAYPAMIKDGNVIKMKVIGDDSGKYRIDSQNPSSQPTEVVAPGNKESKAVRISEYMNWQILHKMENWEEDFDDLLHKVSTYGSMFKKVYLDDATGLKRSDLIYPQFLCINIEAESLERADRITQIFYLSPHEIQQRINEGIYIDFDYETLAEDGVAKPIKFIEQHTRLDLDGDGYPEPYIVIMPDESEEIVGLYKSFDEDDIIYQSDDNTKVSYITAEQFFIHYKFMPDPLGGFYGYGFGALVLKLNNALNSLINQIIDAGHMSLMGGGFIGKGLRMRGGQMRIPMGMYNVVNASGRDLKDNIVPLDFRPPSGTTMSLFEGLNEYIRNTTGMRDVLDGQIRSDQTATATLAQIDNSLNEFKSIFKRIYSSMKKEFKLLYKLNVEFPDDEEYKEVLDDDVSIFDDIGDSYSGFDIYPVADPTELTNMQRQIKAEALLGLAERKLVPLKPAIRDYLKAMGIPDYKEYLDFQPSNQELELQKGLNEASIIEGKNTAKELEIKADKADAEILNDVATAINKLTQAKERGSKIGIEELLALKQLLESKEDGDKQDGVQGVGITPDNQRNDADIAGTPNGIPESINIG